MDRPTSLYLDLLRAAAALAVLLYHASYARFGGAALKPLGLFGNDAVMVFFVLSGFVIGYVADAKENSLGRFAAARLARLWSVALPALALTAVADALGFRLAPALYYMWWQPIAIDHPALSLLASAGFVNELCPVDRAALGCALLVARLRGLVLWLLFAAGFFGRGRLRWAVGAAVALAMGPKILLLFPIWLGGYWLYRRGDRALLGDGWGWLAFLGAPALYLTLLALGVKPAGEAAATALIGAKAYGLLSNGSNLPWDYLTGGLTLLHLLGFFAIRRRLARGLDRTAGPVRRLAGLSFSSYLYHFPLMMLAAAALRPGPAEMGKSLVILLFALAGIALLGCLTEPRRSWLRRPLEKVFGA